MMIQPSNNQVQLNPNYQNAGVQNMQNYPCNTQNMNVTQSVQQNCMPNKNSPLQEVIGVLTNLITTIVQMLTQVISAVIGQNGAGASGQTGGNSMAGSDALNTPAGTSSTQASSTEKKSDSNGLGRLVDFGKGVAEIFGFGGSDKGSDKGSGSWWSDIASWGKSLFGF